MIRLAGDLPKLKDLMTHLLVLEAKRRGINCDLASNGAAGHSVTGPALMALMCRQKKLKQAADRNWRNVQAVRLGIVRLIGVEECYERNAQVRVDLGRKRVDIYLQARPRRAHGHVVIYYDRGEIVLECGRPPAGGRRRSKRRRQFA